MLTDEQKNTLKEDDGGFYIEIPEDNSEVPQENVQEQNSGPVEGEKNVIPEKFSKSTKEDVVSSYLNLEKSHGTLANEIGLLRKELEEVKKQTNYKDQAKELDPEVIKNEIEKLKKNMAEYLDSDDFDQREYAKMDEQLEKHKESLIDAEVEYRTRKLFASTENPKALDAFREQFDKGAFSDEQLNTAYELAVNNLSDKRGIITTDDLHASCMKLYGGAYHAALRSNIEKKVREDIQKVSDIKVPTISRDQKTTKRINIKDLSYKEKIELMKTLSQDDINKLLGR